MEQLTLGVAEPPGTPGACPHEKKVADFGGGKSLCARMGKWTNCREAGHCTAAGGRERT